MYSQVNGLLTWSIPIIIPYDAIFSNILWSGTYCLVFSNGLDWFQTGFTNDFLFNYNQEWMILCILLSVLVHVESQS